jgi:hypothetical protein
VSQTAAIWLVILAALVAANLAFPQPPGGVVGPVASPRKGLLMRLVELVVLYFLVGGFAMLLERRAGQNAPQGWEFYAITGSLFLTFAFPGFVWRFLIKRSQIK